jgi:hypothetical protein
MKQRGLGIRDAMTLGLLHQRQSPENGHSTGGGASGRVGKVVPHSAVYGA